MNVVSIDDPKLNSYFENCLNSGGIVIYPTDTCYGAGVDATNTEAVAELKRYKSFHSSKPLSIAVSSKRMAEIYVDINSQADNIFTNFLPGKITVIANHKTGLASNVISPFGTVGIRHIDYPKINEIIANYDKPITTTSANSKGKKIPYSVQDLEKSLSERQKQMIGLIIDAGELPRTPKSSVVDTTKSSMQVLRRGQVRTQSPIYTSQIKSAEEMISVGKQFADQYLSNRVDPVVVLFQAELGAGKTHFTKGIGESLKIAEVIKSPTYSILEEYNIPETDNLLIHMDAWRLEGSEEFEKLNIANHVKPGSILVMEWAGESYEYLDKLNILENTEIFEITIEYVDLSTREIRIYR